MSDPEKFSESSSITFGGSCACGRITYETTGEPKPGQTTVCHCVTCRKLSGGPYQAFADVDGSSVTFFDHKEHLKYEGLPKDNIGGIVFLRFSKAGERAFCRSCYSPLAMRYKHDAGITALALGAVDEASIRDSKVKEALGLKIHIFTSQKAWWVDIENDGLPKHKRFNGDFEDKMQSWGGSTA